jgi:hypothetical protein
MKELERYLIFYASKLVDKIFSDPGMIVSRGIHDMDDDVHAASMDKSRGMEMNDPWSSIHRHLQGVQKVLSLVPPSPSLASCTLGIWGIEVAHSCHYAP